MTSQRFAALEKHAKSEFDGHPTRTRSQGASAPSQVYPRAVFGPVSTVLHRLLMAALCFAPACKTPDAARLKDNPVQPAAPVLAGDRPKHPDGYLSKDENFALWKQYCAGSENPADEVQPNYANTAVAGAAKILSTVKKSSFRIYGDILKLHKTTLPANANGVTAEAHDFLTYLCGEFRDRAPMVKAKLAWVANIRYLAPGDGGAMKSCEDRNNPVLGDAAAAELPAVGVFDRHKSPWAQMCTEDYQLYIALTARVFDERLAAIDSNEGLVLDDGSVIQGRQKIGSVNRIDHAVPGFTICETKYQFAAYVKPRREFTTLADYLTGYAAFKADCSAEDLAYVYDFRGDSNYKPNSPESNGMIWMSKLAAAQCKDRATAKAGAAWTTADCQRYYAEPFRSRYESARALLGSWLLYAKEHEADFANRPADRSGTQITGVGRNFKNAGDVFSGDGPLQFRVGDTFVQNGGLRTVGTEGAFLADFEAHWHEPDFGLSRIAGVEGEALKEFVFYRISLAVDRHTNWYASGYDSAPTLPLGNSLRRTSGAAYSPFVASSYEMNQSNKFSQCGFTIECGNAGPEFTEHKQWMFIFKVKASNWFRPEDVIAGRLTPDFDRTWFDETSFGFDGLADEERAWDRLGSPLEDEHAEILYLYRIPSEEGN